MKKLLSLSLACILALGLCTSALAGTPEGLPEETDGLIDDGRVIEVPERTLTLVVNGVPTDVEMEFVGWSTYAPAAELRAILGAAVAPTYDGAVPIRKTAEAAGWTVCWYDKPGRQEVQLWNKERFLAEVGPRVEPVERLYTALMTLARQVLFPDTAKLQTETVTVTCTDEEGKDYTVRGKLTALIEKGMVDATLTLDARELAPLLEVEEKELAACKAEVVLDCNTGGVALRVPLLGRLMDDERAAGWQVVYYPALAQMLQEGAAPNYGETLYEAMLTLAARVGGVWAREDVVDLPLAVCDAFYGSSNLKFTGSSLSYEMTAAQANAAVAALDEDAPEELFDKCAVNMTLSASGVYDLVADILLDADGTQLELAAAAHGDLTRADASLRARLDGFGGVQVEDSSTAVDAAAHPRRVVDLERRLVYDPLGRGN